MTIWDHKYVGSPWDEGDAGVLGLPGLEDSLSDLGPAAGGEGEDVPGGEETADLLLDVNTEIW